MNCTLPKNLEIGGTEYQIRSDYRATLDVCAALNDPDLSEEERAIAALAVFYPDFDVMPAAHVQEALERCYWFLNGGEEPDGQGGPRLMDWEQDFARIAPPVNRVLGRDVRGEEYLHWWTFLAAYYEIGDCLFAQIVRIRSKRAAGKTLDKADREFYRKNRKLVDLAVRHTSEEQALLKQWT